MLVLTLFLSSSGAVASDVSVSLTQNLFVNDNVESSLGVAVSLTGDCGLGVEVGGEEIPRRFGGQDGAKIGLYSLSIVGRKEVSPNLSFALKVGYYLPFPELHPAFLLGDAAHYAFSNVLGISVGDPRYRIWRIYDYDVRAGFGGSVGVGYGYDLGDRLSLSFGVGWRCLKLVETITGYDEPMVVKKLMEVGAGSGVSDVEYWEIKTDTDFSGGFVGLGIRVRF